MLIPILHPASGAERRNPALPRIKKQHLDDPRTPRVCKVDFSSSEPLHTDRTAGIELHIAISSYSSDTVFVSCWRGGAGREERERVVYSVPKICSISIVLYRPGSGLCMWGGTAVLGFVTSIGAGDGDIRERLGYFSYLSPTHFSHTYNPSPVSPLPPLIAISSGSNWSRRTPNWSGLLAHAQSGHAWQKQKQPACLAPTPQLR